MTNASTLVFRQLYDQETSTYTYILGDSVSKDAIVIDPVLEKVDRDLALVDELGLTLKYSLDTHVHADHITGSGEIRSRRPVVKTGISASAGPECADLMLKEGDVLRFGSFELKIFSTPGHTSGCLSFLCGDHLFTGDSLMIRAAGRTDFQQGSAALLYDSITQKLFKLSDDTLVYPGHDYQGRSVSTIGEEKKFNARIGGQSGVKSKDEFVKIMNSLNLATPKKMHMAVPANLSCGKISKSETEKLSP